MRYINIGGEVIPKHCKFGPRPKEGVVLNNYEWWSITDHLVKEQRERDLAAVLKAKDEAKKEISFEMTRNWSNTLASIKTQGNQKRQEKMAKLQQDKIETYNRILENRKEEKKKLLDDVKKTLFDLKDPVVTLNSAILYSQVLEIRRKQIEEQNLRKKRAAQKDEEWVKEIKRVAQEEERENLEKKMKEADKLKIQKLELEEQIAERKRRQKEIEMAEKAAEQEDVINMKIEGEKIHKCNMVERDYRKRFTARYIKKTDNQLAYERNVALEEMEEDEINRIFQEYERKYKKERKEREEKIKNEEVEKRVKRSEILAQKLLEAKLKEEERIAAYMLEKDRKEQELADEKEELRRQGVADVLEGKRKAVEKRNKEIIERKEEKKWEMMQQYRRSEVNLQWQEERKKQERELQAERSRFLDLQCKELRERQAEEKREFEEPLEDEEIEKEELRQYFNEVLEFARDEKLPEHPILHTIMKLKKKHHLFDKKELEEMKKQKEKEQAKNACENPKPKFRAVGCYCLKD